MKQETGEPNPPAPPPRRRRARRWPWLLLGAGLVVGVLYSPALLGNFMLSRVGGDLGLEGGKVGGPLWAPSLSGGNVKLPGVTASAGKAQVNVVSVSPGSKTVRINVTVKDATVNLNMAQLIGSLGKPGTAGGSGWKVVLNGLNVQQSTVNVDGKGVNIPSAVLRLSPAQGTSSPDGTAKKTVLIHGGTNEGPLSARLQVGEGPQGNRFILNFDADARVLRQYWPGVQSGWLRGRYVLGDGPVQGDVKVFRGVLQVPQAKFVQVRDVQGSAQHRGDSVTLDLQGRGWNGPVTAHGSVDLKAKHWTVTADATPTVAGLARSLNTTGQGDLKLRVTAGGWSTVRVKGYVQGSGKLAGIAFDNANAEYTFLNRDGQKTAQTNDLAFSGTTLLAGKQQVEGRWAFGRGGNATLRGDLGGKPLDAQATIDAANNVTLAGRALGGPVSAGVILRPGQEPQLTGKLNPSYAGLKASVALSGTPQDLRATVQNGNVGPFPLAGTVRLSSSGPERGFRADLGTVRLNLDQRFRGTWQVRNLSGQGVSLSGQGQLDVNSGDVQGQLQARLPGLSAPLSGPLKVNYLRRSGEYAPGAQALRWLDDQFSMRLSNLPVAGGVKLSGNLLLDTKKGANATGQIRFTGNNVNVLAVATGASATLNGTAAGIPLAGQVQFQAPYLATARVPGTGVTAQVSVQNGVNFVLNTGAEQLTGQVQGGQVKASGQVNLSALRGLPTAPNLSGLVGVKASSGGGMTSLNLQTVSPVQVGEGGPALHLKAAQLNLDSNLRGRWQVQGLTGAGAALDGSGRVDVNTGAVSGNMRALLPGVQGTLTGPLDLNFKSRQGAFRPDGQVLAWQGERAQLRLNRLPLSMGATASGNMLVTTDLKAYGTLDLTGNGYDLTATATGAQAALRGTAGGVRVAAQSSLKAPYQTTAQIEGTDVRGTLSVQNGVRFTLTTLGQQASGVLNGQHWDAQGRVNLRALRPLLPLKDLTGTLDLNLRGQGGTVAVQAAAQGTRVRGMLTRSAGADTLGSVVANLTATLPAVNSAGVTDERPELTLRGPVYPEVQVQGNLRALGQTLAVQVAGPYGQLRASVSGRTGPVTLSGVSLPGQPLNVQASLTPNLGVQGTWGDLNVRYDRASGLFSAAGSQRLSALGQSGRVQGRAVWGPGFKGQLNASGVLGGYAAQVTGPWQRLNVLLENDLGLKAAGTVSLPAATYALNVNGPLQVGNDRLTVQGVLRGQGQRPTGQLNVTDVRGGQARVTVRGLEQFSVRATGLSVAGQRLNGQLSSVQGLLNGQLRAGDLLIRAVNSDLSVTGSVAGQSVQATGHLNLPGTVSGLNVRVDGPLVRVQARGDLTRLQGVVDVKAQRYGAGDLSARLPAQRLPLHGSVTGGSLSVGGLTFQGGQWSGSAGLRYALTTPAGTQAGQVRLSGNRNSLNMLPVSGPLGGSLRVWPGVQGTLTADVRPFLPLLPPEVRRNMRGGQLVASVTAAGADLTLRQTQYLQQPLTLAARVDWSKGVQARGSLTHPGSRLPFVYDGRNLEVTGAVLDARALQPVLPGASGQVSLSLSVPGLNTAQANGLAHVNLTQRGQRAQGNVTVRNGQWNADLHSTLNGYAVQVRGPLFPQANALLSIRQTADRNPAATDFTATLRGDARRELSLAAQGTVQGRSVNLKAVAGGLNGSRAQARVTGLAAGGTLDLTFKRLTGTGQGSGLGAWQAGGDVNFPQLSELLPGQEGQARAVLAGTLADLRVTATGRVGSVSFTAPARFTGGTLRVNQAVATLPQGNVNLSGQVLPALKLDGTARLQGDLPGHFTAQVRGTPGRPEVTVTGDLTGAEPDRSGLNLAGTRLNAHLLGQDWAAHLSGPKLSGTVRGKLGTSGPGGVLDAALNVNTRLVSGENVLVVRGSPAWNARTGWRGQTRVTGDTPGGPLDAFLTGNGVLTATGLLGNGTGQAGFTAEFPASLPLKPGGTITVRQLDAGAFWGRAGQLQATGTATLSGKTWAQAGAVFQGRVLDTQGELSSDVNATYAAGRLNASVRGPHLQGAVSLVGGRYDVNLHADEIHAARLLPASAGLDLLTFKGSLAASGSAAGGPERVSLTGVSLRGQHAQAGPFSLHGSAQYQPRGDVLKADLFGSLRGGRITVQGELPSGLNVLVNDVPTSYTGAASFGVGKLNGELTLTGGARDPFISGRLNVVTDELASALTVSGRASAPSLHARTDLKGTARGTVYAELDQVNLQSGTARTRLYGAVQSGEQRVNMDLSGVWPKLSGSVQAEVPSLAEPVTLTGSGDGHYRVNAGAAGGGTLTLNTVSSLIPDLSGSLKLRPLALVAGSQGEAQVQATLSGTLASPALAGTLTTTGAGVGGITLLDTRGTFKGNLSALSGTLTQAGNTVGTLSSSAGLKLTALGVRAAGSEVRATGQVGWNGVADVALTSLGAVSGTLKATFDGRTARVVGGVSTQGFQGNVNVQAAPTGSWQGAVRVTGGPQGLLTDPAQLSVSGPFAHPLLSGQAGLLGAQARVVASSQLVQVRLTDGPGATASGAVQVQPDAAGNWVWSGATSLTRQNLSFSVTPSGPLSNPDVLLSARKGEWQASGTASLEAADVTVTDGDKIGVVVWKNDQLNVNLPGLNLGRLNVPSLNGLLTMTGSMNRDQNGQVNFALTEFTSPQELPLVGLKPSGNVQGQLTLVGGAPRFQAKADLNSGPLSLEAQQIKVDGGNRWAGRLSGSVQKDQGTASLNLTADTGGVRGNVNVNNFVVSVAGRSAQVNGQVVLNGQTFTASGQVGSSQGRLNAQGGLADAFPILQNVLAVRPTGEGYTARAVLNDLEVSKLNLAPGIAGKVSGEANLNDGGGTFFVESSGLRLDGKTLPARVEGTLVQGNWRLRGFLGEGLLATEFTAGLDAQAQVFGRATLRSLPLGAMLSAVSGTSLGEGVVTGAASFRFPLADPASGSATVVAERIRVSTVPDSAAISAGVTPETLTGYGTLDYANRELRNLNVQLSGAGTWSVQGQYTRQKVDVNARFQGTTFTPVLRLIPGLADLNPALKGTVILSAAGTYERPRGQARVEGLTGSMAGLSVQVPQFAAELPDSGAFTGSGRVQTGGTVGSDGTLDLSGQLTLGKLSGTRVTFAGLLAPQVLGALPNTTATLAQDGEAWTLNAQSISVNPVTGGGTLNVSGNVAPRLNLAVTAQNYNLPLNVIYAKESAVTGIVNVVDDGSFIHVNGGADFARLTLGRVNAPNVIPAPGSTPGPSSTGGVQNFQSPLPEELTTFPKPEETAQKRTLPLLNRLLLEDVRVTAPNGIRVDENLARAEFGTSGLTISGTGASPRMTGIIEAQRGSIFLRENEFRILEGKVTFPGEGLYPSFHIVAQGTVPSTTTNQRVPVTLQLDGNYLTQGAQTNVLNLVTTLSCADTNDRNCLNPETNAVYSEPELYALVATGVPNLTYLPDNLTVLGTSALQTALNVFVLGEVERTLARALGVDVFRLTPTLANDGTINATFTVGSYLTRDLFLQYQVDLTGAGLIDATYNSPDRRFTIKVSTPLTGLDLQSIRPSFSAAYNVSNRASFLVGVVTNPASTKFNFGVTYRIGAR